MLTEERMNGNLSARKGLVLAFVIGLSPVFAHAVMPTNPVSDRDFMRLPDGRNLAEMKVSGVKLTLTRGTGNSFGSSQQASYQNLKQASLSDPNNKIQWVVMNLDGHQVVAQSLSARKRIFGASVTKVYCGGALLDKQAGTLSSSQMQLMADMIVVSSNSAWTNLQKQIGGGDADRGRAGTHAFTQRMGYADTFGFQGTWGHIHGNELTAADLAEYMHDTYKGEYPGAETLWKLMHTGRTGTSRGKKYIPRELFVGGKTGTYDGPTQIDGVAMNVKVRNHMMVMNVNGTEYVIAILNNTGSDENTAVLAGGLLREYTGYRP
jgi:hypothetical protein